MECDAGTGGVSMKATAIRIPLAVLGGAISAVRAMDGVQKQHLVEEIYRLQPNMLGSFLVQKQMGVSYEKMEFLLDILLICFEAMKQSRLPWPLISEDEQDRQLTRYVATVKFGEDLSDALQKRLMQQYIDGHPEQYLLAFVNTETAAWLQRIVPEESDKNVMLAAANLVNCIAFVPMAKATMSKAAVKKTRRGSVIGNLGSGVYGAHTFDDAQ